MQKNYLFALSFADFFVPLQPRMEIHCLYRKVK